MANVIALAPPQIPPTGIGLLDALIHMIRHDPLGGFGMALGPGQAVNRPSAHTILSDFLRRNFAGWSKMGSRDPFGDYVTEFMSGHRPGWNVVGGLPGRLDYFLERQPQNPLDALQKLQNFWNMSGQEAAATVRMGKTLHPDRLSRYLLPEHEKTLLDAITQVLGP